MRLVCYFSQARGPKRHSGTAAAWRRIASPKKWLRIHNSQEWPDYYDEANREDLRRFFDHFLKGEDNGWEQTPRVRYSLLDLGGADHVNLPAAQFPPHGVLDRLARFHEARQTRPHARLKAMRPAEHATLARNRKHDRDWIGGRLCHGGRV